MRCLFVLASLFVLPLARAADVEFVRVWPAWRDAESFDRIGEYFGQPERHQAFVQRTHAEARGGYYFLVRVKAAAAITGAHFDVSVIRPDAPTPQTFSFPAALPARESVAELGLTGADWKNGKKSHPVAWRVALIGGDGRVLAEQKSFLWEKPAK